MIATQPWKQIKRDGYPPEGKEVEVATAVGSQKPTHRLLKMVYQDGIWWRRKGKYLHGVFAAVAPTGWRFLPTRKKK